MKEKTARTINRIISRSSGVLLKERGGALLARHSQIKTKMLITRRIGVTDQTLTPPRAIGEKIKMAATATHKIFL
jgi:hypothetical protein